MNAVQASQIGAAEDRQLIELVDEITAKLQAGEAGDVDYYTARYPEYADRLRDWMTVMSAMADLGHSLAIDGANRAALHSGTEGDTAGLHRDGFPTGILGDYRILGELGRGGMGVVYEAEQISLGRRIALKVLPFAAMLDKQQLARFKNEARAAATLNHPNIVAIHSVGVERGVHYYAMQLIEGQSLAELIADMKPGHLPSLEEVVPAAALIKHSTADDTAKAALPTVRTNGSAFPTMPQFDSREYYRAIAGVGIQAAEALDHATQNGILHRDIKPANLLIDDTGNLWVTDFGLARIEQDAGMTMTGDLLGTLRYMSPEQALAKRVVVDHRSDIYSLGVTLYELVTLQPAFPGDDRQDLLRQIAFDEPRKPRQINFHIPQDLETIILKAIEKNPADRYATARDLADDLQSFVDQRTIKAKPPNAIDVARKWARRNRALVYALAMALSISAIVLAGSIGWIFRDRAVRRSAADAIARSGLKQADDFIRQEKWPESLSAINRAEDALADWGDSDVAARTNELHKDVDMALRLEEIERSPFELSTTQSTFDVYDATVRLRNRDIGSKLAKAFRDYRIDVDAINPSEAAMRIQRRTIRIQLALALDFWAGWLRDGKESGWDRLIMAARLADPHPLRNRLRDMRSLAEDERKTALISLAASLNTADIDPHTVAQLAEMLSDVGADREAIKQLLATQTKYPNNFLVNYTLAFMYDHMKPADLDNALRFYTVAVALRPADCHVRNNLASCYAQQGFHDAAIAQYKETIQFEPRDFITHFNLGRQLFRQGLLDDAANCFQTAAQLEPDFSEAHFFLGETLAKRGASDQAIAQYREALRLSPNFSVARSLVIKSLIAQGQLGEARTLCKDGLQQTDERGVAGVLECISELAEALRATGRNNDATALYADALQTHIARFGRQNPVSIGLYRATGKLNDAIDESRKTLSVQVSERGKNGRKIPDERLFLADLYLADRQYMNAEHEYRELLSSSTESDSDLPRYLHTKLAECLLRQGKDDDSTHQLFGNLLDEQLKKFTSSEATNLRRAIADLPDSNASSEGTPGQDGLYFDGAGDYVILPNLHFDGRPPWTLETIVNPVDIDRGSDGWTSLVSTAEGGSIALEALTDKWSFDIYATGAGSDRWWQLNYITTTSPTPLKLQEWQHVAGVWDGKELRLYVNGKLQATRLGVDYCTNLSVCPFFLGADPGFNSGNIAQGNLRGRMRAARISRGVEYVNPFSQPDQLDNTPNTIGLYDFTRDTGEYAIDRSGHGHHGVIIGANFVRAEKLKPKAEVNISDKSQ